MVTTSNAKPTKHSIAFYWRDEQEGFSTVKRADDDPALPGVWGLVGGSLGPGETFEEAITRAGRDKLGVTVEILRFTGEDTIDRGPYLNHLREYEVKIISGAPSVPQSDRTISQYVDLKMTDDPRILLPAAEAGSLCSRIFLRNAGLWPKSEARA